jgi:hypothetical protein
MIFPSLVGMSLTKLSLTGNNLIITAARESLVSDIPAGDGKNYNLFLQCSPCKLRFLCKEKRRKKKLEYLLKCWEGTWRELVSGGGLGRGGGGELCFIL